MKSKVDKLDVDKLVPVPVDLSKLGDVAKSDVIRKDVYNAKIKNIEDEIPDITNLAIDTAIYDKTNEVKNKIPSITSLTSENFTARLKKANLASKSGIANSVKRQI